ncbi:MAG TPA: adenosine deaminase [Candidatus Saccharimonadales bacterium]|jgi:adenosine deaminase|nr:adenosine deaminase [Candidatus Saccharimonadales bacterium]
MSAGIEPLPRIELHLHLDCSLSYKVVARINPAISEAQYRNTFVAPRKCSSLVEFLTHSPHGFRLMQSKAQLRLVVEDLFEQLAADGVIYAEIRFAPLLHLEQGLKPEEVVEAVDEAVKDCILRTGIEARLILCTLRHYTTAQSLETAELVSNFRGSRVVALDIAGDEAGYLLAPHKPAFDYAHEHGLYITAHAGEAAGPSSVWETLRDLCPMRIGHGIRSAEDPELLAVLRDKGIHLEVCPSSNVQTSVCGALRDHPVDQLYKAGVSLGINTDTRTITDTTLEREYRELSRAFGWGREQFLRCNQEALRAAFLPEGSKRELQRKITAASQS